MKNQSTHPARVIDQRVNKLKIEGQRKINKSKVMEVIYLSAGLVVFLYTVFVVVTQ